MDRAQYINGNPSDEEAAAAIAAIERFLADTTVVAAGDDGQINGWQRAARHEAIGLLDTSPIW